LVGGSKVKVLVAPILDPKIKINFTNLLIQNQFKPPNSK